MCLLMFGVGNVCTVDIAVGSRGRLFVDRFTHTAAHGSGYREGGDVGEPEKMWTLPAVHFNALSTTLGL